MRLSGGGERQSLEDMTPRLINSSINNDSANEIPVVTSCSGVPLMGFMSNSIANAQQFIIAKSVIIMKPVEIECVIW